VDIPQLTEAQGPDQDRHRDPSAWPPAIRYAVAQDTPRYWKLRIATIVVYKIAKDTGPLLAIIHRKKSTVLLTFASCAAECYGMTAPHPALPEPARRPAQGLRHQPRDGGARGLQGPPQRLRALARAVLHPEYEIETKTKERRYVDGASSRAALPFGYWEAKDEKDDLNAESSTSCAAATRRTTSSSRFPEVVLMQNGQVVMRAPVDVVAKSNFLLGLFFGYERRRSHSSARRWISSRPTTHGAR